MIEMLSTDLPQQVHDPGPHDILTWGTFEQDLIQAVVDYANMHHSLKGTRLEEAVEDLFFPFTRELWISLRSKPGKALLGPVYYRRGLWFVPEGAMGPMGRRGGGPVSENVDALSRPRVARDAGILPYEDLKTAYFEWGELLWKGLYDLASPGDADSQNYAKGVQDFAQRVIPQMPCHLEAMGKEMVCCLSIETVDAAVAFGWLILRSSGYPTRQCLECLENFFVVFNGRQQARLYCMDCVKDVRSKQNIARVVKSRAKRRTKERGKK